MELTLAALSREISQHINALAPSVVAVHGRRHTPSSGVVWKDGVIVTAEHALWKGDDIMITTPEGGTLTAKVAGRDSGSDIAVLRFDGHTMPPVKISTGEIYPGNAAIVVGRSPNSGVNGSFGVVSAVSGSWRTWRGGQLERYCRLDVTLFPGSSGGAVANERGEVIGIATSALSRVAPLAIPSEAVNRIVTQILEKGRVPQGYLGIGLQSVPLPEGFQKEFSASRSQALMVLTVEPGGPADKGGILVGDIVLELDGKAVETIEDIQSRLHGESVGTSLAARIIRGGEEKSCTLRVEERVRK
jgi:S1-C subfamily serine protease